MVAVLISKEGKVTIGTSRSNWQRDRGIEKKPNPAITQLYKENGWEHGFDFQCAEVEAAGKMIEQGGTVEEATVYSMNSKKSAVGIYHKPCENCCDHMATTISGMCENTKGEIMIQVKQLKDYTRRVMEAAGWYPGRREDMEIPFEGVK